MNWFEPIYEKGLRPLFFRIDPERIHEMVLHTLPYLHPFRKGMEMLCSFKDPLLVQDIWNIHWPNPIGLAGGFDKNALCPHLWSSLGFSHIEIGTVTPKPQPGNPKPRLFRYPQEKALVNRMGFNNDGAEIIAQRLATFQKYKSCTIGVSIGKQFDTPITDIEHVIDDYVTTLRTLYPYGDYFAVNVSSPNTVNLRALQHAQILQRLINTLLLTIEDCGGKTPSKPLCVKFAPDLSDEELHDAIAVVSECGIDGIIATNTTNQTGERETGGLSGAPLRERSTEMIAKIAEQTHGEIPIIGCGGIFTAKHAIEKLRAGAWLLQVYTGFVYQGPTMAKSILKGVGQYMEENDISSLAAFRLGN